MEQKKIKRIYKKAVAIELRKLGYSIIGTEINPTKPQFDVYLFYDTERFQVALTKALAIVEENKKQMANSQDAD